MPSGNAGGVSDRSSSLIRPTRVPILSFGCQLPRIRAVGEHRPDLLGARAVRLKDQVAAVGRPGGVLVALGIVGELDNAARGGLDHVGVVSPSRRGTGGD